MATYAEQADCLAYTEGLVIDDEDAFEGLLVHAERDVDRLLGPWAQYSTGLKLADENGVLSWLTDAQKLALKNATCAQAAFRVAVGPDTFTAPVAAVKRKKGPEFEIEYFDAGSAVGTVGSVPIAEAARGELIGSGLIRTTAAAL